MATLSSKFTSLTITDPATQKILSAPIIVADATARKLLATYTALDTVPYVGMRVTQVDQNAGAYPTAEYLLNSADVTQDTNWFLRPLSNPETGEFVVDLRLADFTGIVPPLNSIGQIDGSLRIGDGATEGGAAPVNAAGISDSTSAGRAMLTAANAASQAELLGALTDHSGVPATMTLVADASDNVKGYNLTTIPAELYKNAYTIKGVSIGQGVTSIGDEAFYNCNALTGLLVLPDSLTSIGASAFAICTDITGHLKIPSGVTALPLGVFQNCDFTTITLPEGLLSIGDYALMENNITEITIPSSVTSIGEMAFALTGTLATVYLYAEGVPFGANALLLTGNPVTIHVKASDTSWTAGAQQEIAGNLNVTVVKDL